MSIELARSILLWCTVINYAVLTIWFLAYVLAHGWLCRLWAGWFHLTEEQIDSMTFGVMALYKVGVLLFNLVPCVALYIVR
ncbi:MAG TPA: hypothetical protein VN893_01785 [Bryobacteraceae bacterium]|jgi:hypothetical protein|nr:hypothetical protein [Bryobacteraceae bacterium]